MGLRDVLMPDRDNSDEQKRDADIGRAAANGYFYRQPARYDPDIQTNRAADGQIVGHVTRDPGIKRKPDGKFTKDDDDGGGLMPEIGADAMEALDPSDSRPTGAALMTEPRSEQPNMGTLSNEIRDFEPGRQTTAEEWGHGVLDLTTGGRS